MIALRRSVQRIFVRTYAEGSSGSFRGEGSGDSFTKRERASEDYYVKQHEQESLKKLREEIEKREKDLKDLKEREKELS